jgi:hypothetical protein
MSYALTSLLQRPEMREHVAHKFLLELDANLQAETRHAAVTRISVQATCPLARVRYGTAPSLAVTGEGDDRSALTVPRGQLQA